jgi:hypothetical protein
VEIEDDVSPKRTRDRELVEITQKKSPIKSRMEFKTILNKKKTEKNPSVPSSD